MPKQIICCYFVREGFLESCVTSGAMQLLTLVLLPQQLMQIGSGTVWIRKSDPITGKYESQQSALKKQIRFAFSHNNARVKDLEVKLISAIV